MFAVVPFLCVPIVGGVAALADGYLPGKKVGETTHVPLACCVTEEP
jgi:hypothetical protein